MNRNTNGPIAWLSLIIAIIALIVGWTAFNRAGTDLEDIVEQQVDEAVQEIEAEYQRTEREVREETSEALIEAGDDVRVDSDENNPGE